MIDMVILMISSLTNEKIKYLIKLQDKKFRNEEHKFLVEGPHLIEEAKNANMLVETYTTKENVDGILVSEPVMKKISQTTSIPYVIGVCKMLDKKELSNKILMLDDVSDPTNLGTLLRSAKSFGFNTVITSLNSVDFYNDKVIRGSQGAIFKLNLINADLESKIGELKKNYKIYGTNVREGVNVKEIKNKDHIVLLLGNETRGLNLNLQKLADKNLFIELDQMESLNLSVAGSILMYELK